MVDGPGTRASACAAPVMALFFGAPAARIVTNRGVIMTITGYQETFQIGRVLSRAFGVISRNLVTFLVISALWMVPMLLLTALFSQQMTVAVTMIAQNPGLYFGILIGTMLVQTVFYYLLLASLSHASIADLNGERPQIIPTLSSGLRILVPIAILSILALLGIVAGFILLVIPGIMLAVWWSVIVPVRVVENTGITETFGRSRALTKGYRWRIFGLFLMFGVAMLLAGFAIRLVMGLSLLEDNPADAFSASSLIASGLVNIPLYGILAAGVASIYYELRLVKEGIGPQQVADVFN
jgi:hypothetical protein